MVKVTKTEVVVSSKCEKSLKWARMESASVQIVTVRPTGTEYCIIFRAKRFLMRSVFFSSASIKAGKPMQAKLSRLISMGVKGYLRGRKTNNTARIEA